MKRELFRKYLWLIDLVRHHKRITFEEISRKWDEASVNIDHAPLALRTFHNHRDAIEALFGIRILCNRSDHNTYYIPEDESASSTRLKIWMLQTLTMSHLIESGKSPLTDRVLMDMPHDGQLALATIIEAMRDEVTMLISYNDLTDGKIDLEIGPYCLRYWQNRWFFLAEVIATGELKVFDLSRLMSITTTENYFEFPQEFSPREYFKDYFGFPDGESDDKSTIITVRLSGRARDEVRVSPLHESQREINKLKDGSLFTFKVVPNNAFFDRVLAMGDEAEIVTPPAVRRQMRDRVMRLADQYESRPDPALVYRARVGLKTVKV